MGANDHGQLGLGNSTRTSKSTPQLVTGLCDFRIIKVFAGGNSSFALSIEGKLFAWGQNNEGQLGLGTFNKMYTPAQVNLPSNVQIRSVRSSEYHTLIIGAVGEVFVSGRNENGLLGLGDVDSMNCFVQNQYLKQNIFILDASTSAKASLLLTSNSNMIHR